MISYESNAIGVPNLITHMQLLAQDKLSTNNIACTGAHHACRQNAGPVLERRMDETPSGYKAAIADRPRHQGRLRSGFMKERRNAVGSEASPVSVE